MQAAVAGLKNKRAATATTRKEVDLHVTYIRDEIWSSCSGVLK